MTRQSTIDLLRALAQRRLDAALARVAQAQAQQRQAMQQHDLLQQYQRDYQQRRRALETTHVLELANFTTFLGNLASATTQQADQVEAAAARLAAARAEWDEARRKQGAIEVLAERRAASERLAAERLDRKLQDELAARMSRLATAPLI